MFENKISLPENTDTHLKTHQMFPGTYICFQVVPSMAFHYHHISFTSEKCVVARGPYQIIAFQYCGKCKRIRKIVVIESKTCLPENTCFHLKTHTGFPRCAYTFPGGLKHLTLPLSSLIHMRRHVLLREAISDQTGCERGAGAAAMVLADLGKSKRQPDGKQHCRVGWRDRSTWQYAGVTAAK